jgi:hypothetical protein
MAYIEVDVDMEDFDSEDLVEEVCKRLAQPSGHSRGISKALRAELGEYFKNNPQSEGIEELNF